MNGLPGRIRRARRGGARKLDPRRGSDGGSCRSRPDATNVATATSEHTIGQTLNFPQQVGQLAHADHRHPIPDRWISHPAATRLLEAPPLDGFISRRFCLTFHSVG